MKNVKVLCGMLSIMKEIQKENPQKRKIIDAKLGLHDQRPYLQLTEELFKECFEVYDIEPYDNEHDMISTFVDGVDIFALVEKEEQI